MSGNMLPSCRYIERADVKKHLWWATCTCNSTKFPCLTYVQGIVYYHYEGRADNKALRMRWFICNYCEFPRHQPQISIPWRAHTPGVTLPAPCTSNKSVSHLS
jgi:hypothetical protein